MRLVLLCLVSTLVIQYGDSQNTNALFFEGFKGEDLCACGENAHFNLTMNGLVCECKNGYTGDPYLGCVPQVINECKSCGINTECEYNNVIRVTTCACKPNYYGNPIKGCYSRKLRTLGHIEYQYRAATLPLLVKFKVKAERDAHIIFAESSNITGSYRKVEIFIGGWGNTKSVLSQDGFELISNSTHNILSAQKFRGFWISYFDSVIAVGREGEEKSFLKWTNLGPVNIKFIGFRSTFGVRAHWILENGEKIITSDAPAYNFQPVYSDTLRFKVKSLRDAFIVLSETEHIEDPDLRTEIVIGGWGNRKSVIQRGNSTEFNADVSTPDILDKDEFRSFWIKYSGGVIAVGKDCEVEPFMNWTDPSPFNVKYFGVRTSWGAIGDWVLYEDGPWMCGWTPS